VNSNDEGVGDADMNEVIEHGDMGGVDVESHVADGWYID
jgi:hypothetical protein